MARSYWDKLQTLEMVTCSGQNQTGAMHILQRGVSPACIKPSQLEAVQGQGLGWGSAEVLFIPLL